MKLALKIDVGTWRGTTAGVPRLLEILDRHQAQATFLFCMGPDRSGRAPDQLSRLGFSMIEHYGFATLLYGTLLPAPNIGERCGSVLFNVSKGGFEVGIHAYDRMAWQARIAAADAGWTERQMQRACRRFETIFGSRPKVHGAPGWQMNRHAWRLTQRLGFDYGSDTRGSQPFIPIHDAEIIACPQLPTTLPTLDEVMANRTADDAVEYLLKLTADPLPTGHVYTLRAEFEGLKLAPVFEQLLNGWRAQGYDLVSLRDYFMALTPKTLPRCMVSTVAGQRSMHAMQGAEFLAAV